jgi:hypothetical protein
VRNVRQKGFTSQNGCNINVEIFNTALDLSKREHGGVFVIVDISKAFDTVPHSAIMPCLTRKGISTPLIELFKNMYKGSKTKIKAKNGTEIEIEILRRVKQGDPLSPLLFNLCLEPLLEAAEESTEGIKINNDNKIAILAFADDVVLLDNNKREAQRNISIVQEYLEGLGMSISEDKSQTFQVVSKKDTWYVKDPEIEISNKKVLYIAPEDAFRYLGAKIGPWKGLQCGIIVPEVVIMIKRVKKLPLKPDQKMEFLHLQRAAKEKVDKYSSFLNELKKTYGIDERAVLPMVPGSKRAITLETINDLKIPGI